MYILYKFDIPKIYETETKFQKKFLTFGRLYGTIIPARGKENPTNRKGRKKMEFYGMEKYEMMGDLMESYQEWLDFEADMATNPYDDPFFAW